MDTTKQSGRHSAIVQMELHVNDHILSIGQLGPDFIFLCNPINHPPAKAEISLSIDGRVRRWPVHLPDGITVGQDKTRIE